jgi:arylsulfatase A-like enzyme
MKSKYLIRTFSIHLILIPLLVLLLQGCSKHRAHRPNVLFIFVDDLRTQLGCYGHPWMATPSIDQLASGGILFANAYCNVPVCGASRASVMSGMRGTPTRFVNWFVRMEEDAPGTVSLPEHFLNNGYTTVSLGKVFHHADDCAGSWSVEPWRPDQYPGRKWEGRGYLNTDNRLLSRSNENGYASFFEKGVDPDRKYPDQVLAEKAIEQLRVLGSQQEPFFLAVGFFKPHLPFNAPRAYWDLYKPSREMLAGNPFRPVDAPDEAFYSLGQLRQPGFPATAEDSADVYPTKEMRWYDGIPAYGGIPDSTAVRLVHGYCAAVSFIDNLVGRVLGSLHELGLAENTVVVLLGDHGWHLGEHGLWCKHCNFDNVLRTPLMIRVPWMEAGRTSALAEFVDIYPTLCDLCGLDRPGHLEGLSLVPLLEEPEREGKEAVFLRYHAGNTVKTHSYAYTEWYDEGGQLQGRMLYDHEQDPEENVNLAEKPGYEEVVKELQLKLFETWPEPAGNPVR